MTLAWSAANLSPFSVTSTCTLFVKLMALRSWYSGRVELATARKMGGVGAEPWLSMVTCGWRARKGKYQGLSGGRVFGNRKIDLV